jgi:hypothetical protein
MLRFFRGEDSLEAPSFWNGFASGAVAPAIRLSKRTPALKWKKISQQIRGLIAELSGRLYDEKQRRQGTFPARARSP